MPSIVATAIGGSALIGGAASLIGSSKQASAADKSAALQQQQFEEARQDQAPWRAAGQQALGQQTNLLGLNGQPAQQNAFASFRADPGYQYTVDQAVQGVDRSAAARGLLTSGATIKAIQDRAANLADQGYNTFYNRLAGVSGTGQAATTTTDQLGAASATNQGNALMQAGNAQASGYNGVASGVNQGLNNYFAYNGVGGGSSGYNPAAYIGNQVAGSPYGMFANSPNGGLIGGV